MCSLSKPYGRLPAIKTPLYRFVAGPYRSLRLTVAPEDGVHWMVIVDPAGT
jgi:hypothetical protein